MKKTLAAGLLAAFVMMASSAFAAGAGEDVYKAKCASCHGANGAGAMATKMGSKPLTSPEVQGKSEADLVSLITNGKGKMPAYKGKLTDDQIKAVAQFVKSLK